MAKTPEQIKLGGLYLGVEPNVSTPYLDKFMSANTPFQSFTKKIDLSEMFQGKVVAGFAGRTEHLTSINVDGQVSMVVEPAIVGDTIPEAAEDVILALATMPQETNSETNARLMVDTRNVSRLKASVLNLTERLCAEMFLEGSGIMTTPSGSTYNYDLGLNSRETLDLSGSSNLVTEIATISEQYEFDWGVIPEIEVGKNVFAAIQNEINNSVGKKNRMDYTIKDGVMTIDALGLVIKKLKPAVKASDGTTIDTSNYMQVYTPKVLIMAFAGLPYVGTVQGRAELVAQQYLVDRTLADRQTGVSEIFAKSAPMACITYVDMFDRYTVTLS